MDDLLKQSLDFSSVFHVFPPSLSCCLKHFISMNLRSDESFGLIDFRWEELEGTVTVCM